MRIGAHEWRCLCGHERAEHHVTYWTGMTTYDECDVDGCSCRMYKSIGDVER